MKDRLDRSARRPDSSSMSNPSRSMLVTLAHYGAPGRIRVKIRGLYRSEILKAALEELPSRNRWLESVSANPLTGNALIRFTPDRPIAHIIDELEQWVRTHWKPRTAALKPQAKARTQGSWNSNTVNVDFFKGQKAAFERPTLQLVENPDVKATSHRPIWHSIKAEEALTTFG